MDAAFDVVIAEGNAGRTLLDVVAIRTCLRVSEAVELVNGTDTLCISIMLTCAVYIAVVMDVIPFDKQIT
jgi:hypothetical protein